MKFPLNGELQLTCSFQGVPPPDTVTWTHNGTELSPTLVTVTATDTTLTRTSLPASAGGAYACSASNEVGSNTANTFVRIQRKLLMFKYFKEVENALCSASWCAQ